jgi:surfactin synthase thioesterase subunit
MARDILEVIDHIGWTKERQLHVIGVSMGGMIAQEIVLQLKYPALSPLLTILGRPCSQPNLLTQLDIYSCSY